MKGQIYLGSNVWTINTSDSISNSSKNKTYDTDIVKYLFKYSFLYNIT